MPLSLIGILTEDPETESLAPDTLTGQYWLVVKETDTAFRALPLDENGQFFGKVQSITEDDLLEHYMPELALFKEFMETPFKKLIPLLAQAQKNDWGDLAPIINALTALIRKQEYKPNLKPSFEELKTINQMIKDFDLLNPNFAFIFSLASMAILHRKNQNYEQSIFYYIKALDIGGEDPNILFNLARAYYEAGAEGRATATLLHVLELSPEMKMAKQFLDFLTPKK